MSGYWRQTGSEKNYIDGTALPVFADSSADATLSGVAAPGAFPPTYLLAGCADHTVPWFESAEFHLALRDANVPSRLCLYLKENHGEFVVGWNPRPDAKKAGDMNRRKTTVWGDESAVNAWDDGLDGDLEAQGLSAHNRDVLRIIKR
jgi:acetyl esterase/lipase